MAYQIRYALDVVWVPDGAGPMSIPSAQKLRLGTLDFAGLTTNNPTITIAGQPTGYQAVPGLDTPTQGNFNTALAAMQTDLQNAVAANLARILTFATGGG